MNKLLKLDRGGVLGLLAMSAFAAEMVFKNEYFAIAGFVILPFSVYFAMRAGNQRREYVVGVLVTALVLTVVAAIYLSIRFKLI